MIMKYRISVSKTEDLLADKKVAAKSWKIPEVILV